MRFSATTVYSRDKLADFNKFVALEKKWFWIFLSVCTVITLSSFVLLLALGSFEGAGAASGEIGGLDVAPLGTEILFHGLFHICGFRFSIHFRLLPQVRGANLAEGGVVGIVSPTFFTDHRISLLGHIYIETV